MTRSKRAVRSSRRPTIRTVILTLAPNTPANRRNEIETGRAVSELPAIRAAPGMHCHPEERSDEGSAVVLHHSWLPAHQHTMGHMHEGGYFTYIMASRSRTLYVGVTGDLRRRVFQHKWKEHEGFTARYNCDRLVWFERHPYVQIAITREKELKGWSRSKKIALIDSLNAAWIDLSREWYDCEPADYLRALDRTNS